MELLGTKDKHIELWKMEIMNVLNENRLLRKHLRKRCCLRTSCKKTYF